MAMRKKGHIVIMRSSSMPVLVRDWIMIQRQSKQGGCKTTHTEMHNVVHAVEMVLEIKWKSQLRRDMLKDRTSG